MKGQIFILLFALLIVCPLWGEEPPVERWAVSYMDNSSEATDMVVDKYGNVYVTGYCRGNSFAGTAGDYATIKYDSNGNQLWVVTYDGLGGGSDGAVALAIDGVGNVYVTGSSYGSGTDYDYATIKYDSNGNEKWAARYNGPGNGYDGALAIAVDISGNVYITGASTESGKGYDYATIKYDQNGNQKWVARYNGSGNNWDNARAIAIDNSGNVYVTGGSSGSGTEIDYVTIKYDPNGNQKWVARYNGSGNNNDIAYAIAIDNSGSVYVTGRGWFSDTEYATIKYDPNGNQKWVARYSGTGNSANEARAIATDNSGDVYVTGTSTESGTGYDYATVKYDSNGNEIWVSCYNGPANSSDYARHLVVDESGNVYVTGLSWGSGTDYYDYATVKYDPNGNQKWVSRYSSQINNYDYAMALAIDESGNIYVTGYSGPGYDYPYHWTTIKYTQHDICLGEIEGDLNNDCKVDFADLAMLASHWLECNYAYEGDCL